MNNERLITEDVLVRFLRFCSALLDIATPPLTVTYNKDEENGAGRADHINQTVEINVNDSKRWIEPITAIFHECRHIYQRTFIKKLVFNQEKYSDGTVGIDKSDHLRELFEDHDSTYYESCEEIDAEVFAKVLISSIYGIPTAMPIHNNSEKVEVYQIYFEDMFETNISGKIKDAFRKYKLSEFNSTIQLQGLNEFEQLLNITAEEEQHRP